MRKSVEIKNKIKKLREEAMASTDVEVVKAKTSEIEMLKAQLAIAEEEEVEEEAQVQARLQEEEAKTIVPAVGEEPEAQSRYNEVFAKYVRREALTEDEKLEIKAQLKEGTVADGGATVPFDEDTSIIKLREASDALQNLVTVKKVTTNEGKKTIRIRKAGGTNFVAIGEGSTIETKPTPTYRELTYSVTKYGAIYDITNELDSDSDQDMIAELNEWIGNDSRELRNSLILAELNNKAKTAIENHDDIKDAINETLNTENAKHACYVTNQSGFNLLDKMKDTDGNYILQPVVGEPTKKQIGGKIVHVYDNSILPNDETVGVKAPLIIGDLEMAIVMFDRQVVTVKTSTEGKDAFENDLTLMRALEREDVQTLDDEAFVYGQLTIS